jgi:FkbM family methyltransferase
LTAATRPAPAPATEQDLRYCYRLLLRREPSAADLAAWVAAADQAQLGLDDVRRLFVESLEYRLAFGREIAALQEEWSAPLLVPLPEFDIYVRTNDFLVGAGIAATKTWEPHVRRELEPLLVPGARFVGVGANVGFFTLLAAARVGPAGRVVSFEPNPDNRELLGRSLGANGFANVTLHPHAVGERPGTLWLHPIRNSSLARLAATADGAAVEVPVVALDETLLDVGRVDVIKIDTDGAEPAVLRGARGVIRRHRPAIFLEWAPVLYQGAGGEGPESTLNELRISGYNIRLLADDGASAPRGNDDVLAAVAASAGGHVDLLATPR